MQPGLPFGGSNHKFLRGTHGSSLLTFGFLYEMDDHGTAVNVLKVKDVVDAQWFQDLIGGKEGSFDAIMILGHMDFEDPLVNVILDAIRKVQPKVPVQFITGHSHRRKYKDLDVSSSSFEAGCYLDTIGFASFPRNATASSTLSSGLGQGFEHVFIDTNVDTLKKIAGTDDITTSAGRVLTQAIAKTRKDMNLTDVIGCAPKTYKQSAALNKTDSLMEVYLDGVIRKTLFEGNNSRVLLEHVGSLRYDLYKGNVTKEDIVTMSPFPDQYWLVALNVPGKVITALLKQLNGNQRRYNIQAMGMDDYELPDFVSTKYSSTGTYDLYGVTFDVGTPERPGDLLKALTSITKEKLVPELGFTKDALAIWYEYVATAWPCMKQSDAIII